MEEALLSALAPVILLLALGVVAAVLTRMVGLSPIVGYLALGILLSAAGLAKSSEPIRLLAELGVVFLLFDIGLHFSTRHLKDQARDIFGFGPAQVILGTLGLTVIALLFGLAPAAALLVGATLALSSTAVVARVIVERRQQGCPVGVTSTAILVFQDLAAIFILILATAIGSRAAIAPMLALALLKAAVAFSIAIACGRFLVRPLFAIVVRNRNEEVFAAIALLVALAAGYATGSAGLSLTLGAFLGGMMVSETPYRALIQSEIKPFRGLLLGFFFISIGLSLDVAALGRVWPLVIVVCIVLVATKVLMNAAASLIFRWSVPGSLQLGFLLAQGSEFAFVVFSLPPVRALVGEQASSVLIAAVALSLAVTPNLADVGRKLAGNLRNRRMLTIDAELQPRDLVEPVFIVGMDARGRTIADALENFKIPYASIENDQDRLQDAIADGYHVVYGDLADPRIWEPASMGGRRISVLTEPSLEASGGLTPFAERFFPNLTRMAVIDDQSQAEKFASIGLVPIVDKSQPIGVDAATAVLRRAGVEDLAIESWADRQRRREVELAGA